MNETPKELDAAVKVILAYEPPRERKPKPPVSEKAENSGKPVV